VELVNGVFTSLDKLDKVAPEEVKKEMLERGVPEAATSGLLEAYRVGRSNVSDELRLEYTRKAAAGELEGTAEVDALFAPLREILRLTPPLPSGRLVFDPFLARGMDYYTGPIFEVAAEGVPFSLAGGGRYDELVGLLCGQKVPACGFSIGFERVFEVMEERKMFAGLPPLKWADHWKAFQAADVFVAMAPTKSREDLFELSKESIDLAGKLRGAGLRADLFVGTQKLGSQYELAEGKGIRWAVFLDPQAPHHPQVNLRDLRTRTTEPVLRQAVAALLVERTRNDPPPQSSRADGRP